MVLKACEERNRAARQKQKEFRKAIYQFLSRMCSRAPPFCLFAVIFFFFQAEDGIRDWSVTGVQTCALPISSRRRHRDWSVTGVQTCALPIRSEEHTSELQSLTNLVCRLLNPARARNAS